jgi:hypothetical protein
MPAWLHTEASVGVWDSLPRRLDSGDDCWLQGHSLVLIEDHSPIGLCTPSGPAQHRLPPGSPFSNNPTPCAAPSFARRACEKSAPSLNPIWPCPRLVPGHPFVCWLGTLHLLHFSAFRLHIYAFTYGFALSSTSCILRILPHLITPLLHIHHVSKRTLATI